MVNSKGKDYSYLNDIENADTTKKFFYAMGSKNLPAIKRLINTLIDVNLIDDETGRTPLIYSICTNNTEAMDFLLQIEDIDIEKQDSIYHMNPLHHSCRMKNIDYVKTLMDKGADVNAKSGAKITGCLTPLMICAQVNFTEGINLLLSNEFTKFDQQDIKGRTALHIACIYDNTDSIKLLSDRIDNNIKDINGKKAFDYLD